MPTNIAEQTEIVVSFREDLAMARFWYKNAKTKKAKQAYLKLIYAIIVIYHKDLSQGMHGAFME